MTAQSQIGPFASAATAFARLVREIPETAWGGRTEPAPLTVSVEPDSDQVPDGGNARASTEQKE